VGDLQDATYVQWSVLLLSIGGVLVVALITALYPIQSDWQQRQPRHLQHAD